jgi:two-component system nitrate/nitrite response regulator NarL
MRLVLCDDNRILCEALASFLQAQGHRVLAIATCASEAVEAVSVHNPDVCLLDVRLPDGSGMEAARAMRRKCPETKIVMFSGFNDPAMVSEARKAGVAGFLRKDQKPDSIVRAVEEVGEGGTAFGSATRPPSRRMAAEHRDNRLGAFTPRETEVLERIVAGQSTRQMASEMDVTVSTLRSYIKSVLSKLGVHTRLQAAAVATANQQDSGASAAFTRLPGFAGRSYCHGDQDPYRRPGACIR